MKSLIVALVAMLAIPAIADSNLCSKSWEEVENSQYGGQFPKIQFDSTWVSVDGVCVVGEETLRTINPIEICLKYAPNDSGSCLESANMILETSRDYVRYVPIGDSSDFKMVPERHTLDYVIPVGVERETFQLICNKPYKIEACK